MGAGVGAGVGAHEPSSQAASLERLPHAVPPCAAAAVVVCVRVFVLSPHALLVHALCTQLTGPGAEGGGDHHTR